MSFLISILANAALLCCLLAFSEISALRRSYGRLGPGLAAALGRYRVLMIAPRLAGASGKTADGAAHLRARKLRARIALKPLAEPDPRLLLRLDPQLQEFLADNRELEDIFTREIVRDVDSKVLDIGRLFAKGSLQVSFEPDTAGKLVGTRIDVSSGVPSIDHLALEIVRLLERYQLTWIFQGFSRVVLLIRTEEDVEIRLSCTPRDPDSQESAAKRIQGALALIRIAAAQSDALFLLQDISIRPEKEGITLSRTLSKEPLTDFLMRYWQTGPRQ